MNQKTKKILFAVIAFAFIFSISLASFSMAATACSSDLSESACKGAGGYWNPHPDGTGECSCPFAMPYQVTVVLATVVNYLTIVAGGLALIFLIFGGITFMTAAGDETKLKTARNMITWAFIGLIVVMVAQVFKTIAESIGTSVRSI